jgi:hypothetical protein
MPDKNTIVTSRPQILITALRRHPMRQFVAKIPWNENPMLLKRLNAEADRFS